MRLDVLLDRHISSITWYLVLFLRKCVFGNLLFFVTTIETLEQSRGCSSQSQKVKGFFFFAFGKKRTNSFVTDYVLKANKNQHVFCRQSRDIKERVSVSFSLSPVFENVEDWVSRWRR